MELELKTASEIYETSRGYNLHSWSTQGAIKPKVMVGGEGIYFWDGEGKRYYDMSSQLVNLNIGYGNQKVIKAIQEQAGRLAYSSPAFAIDVRSKLAKMVVDLAPDNMGKVFFTLAGADANENAIKIAKMFTGRHKVFSRYRSYHGSTLGAGNLTGEPRRYPCEPGIPGFIKFFDPYVYRAPFDFETEEAATDYYIGQLREQIIFEGRDSVAAIFLETITGSNGIIIPPKGYLTGVRDLCDEFGILMVCDEVMTGWGRTGEWFAVDNYDVKPDIITFAKGITCGYAPIGGAIVSKEIAEFFETNFLSCGLTYSAHPLGCAAGIATIEYSMQLKTQNKFLLENETNSCLLCHDAPCTKECPHGLDPAKIIRSYRFENTMGSAKLLGGSEHCKTCFETNCVKKCLRGKVDRPVAIPQLLGAIGKARLCENTKAKADLGILFCGIPCENPFFLSSSVVGSNYEMVAKAFEMGWAGVAFKTIGTFVPNEVSPRFATIQSDGNSFIGFKNIENISDHTFEENLEYLRRLKKDYPSKVIIASILGQTEVEWTELAAKMTEVGVDIIECNFSCPHTTEELTGSDVGQNPDLVSRFTAATRRGTHLPILAKMTPNIGNMEIPAIAAIKAGATGIAAINTIKSIININLDDFVSEPKVDDRSCVGGLSGKMVKPIALRYINDIKQHPELRTIPISGMGGIETWRDATEFLALGCTNVQITTSVMQFGYRIIEDLIEGLSIYMEEKGFDTISEMVGKALPNIVGADELNRHSLCFPKINQDACVGCGRCYLSCFDGGHQAIELGAEEGKVKVIGKKCVGCHLCIVVCPVGAITSGKRLERKVFL